MAPVEIVDSVHNNIDSENGIPIGTGSRSAGRAIPIAIIGMSGKFGGEATTASKLWDLCKAGSDAWTPIPRDRFDAESLYDKRKGKTGRVSSPLNARGDRPEVDLRRLVAFRQRRTFPKGRSPVRLGVLQLHHGRGKRM